MPTQKNAGPANSESRAGGVTDEWIGAEPLAADIDAAAFKERLTCTATPRNWPER